MRRPQCVQESEDNLTPKEETGVPHEAPRPSEEATALLETESDLLLLGTLQDALLLLLPCHFLSLYQSPCHIEGESAQHKSP